MAPLPTLTSKVAAVGQGVSANDTLVDLYMQRAIDLIRLEAGTRNKVLALLAKLESDLVGQLSVVDPSGTPLPYLQQQRLNALLVSVRSAIQAAYRPINALMASETRNIADTEATWTANAIDASTHAQFANSGLTTTQLDTLVSNVLIQGAPTAEWWGRQAAGLSDRFADEMRRGVALGENNADLIQRVRGPTGLMNLSRNSAERLVRASVQTAANAARNATYAENSDLITAVMWHATLDTRTSEWCLARDGCQYTPTDHESIDDAPPWLEGPGAIHWGCRSTSIPILKSWQDIGIDEAEVPHTTRASMDGQVPAKQNFEEWLSKQNETRQDTVLGTTKAQLWRDGKITFRDLLDQNGRPLTTEQVQANAAAQE